MSAEYQENHDTYLDEKWKGTFHNLSKIAYAFFAEGVLVGIYESKDELKAKNSESLRIIRPNL